MNQNKLFIKLISDYEISLKIQRFIKEHPKAWCLLTIIALRTDRNTGKAKLGDFKNYGMTKQEYRTAKQVLEKERLCDFITTNKGTIAKISDLFLDLNINTQNNTQATHKITREITHKENLEDVENTTQNEDIQIEYNTQDNTQDIPDLTLKSTTNKEYIKNKEYSNNINIITSETGSKKDVNSLIPLFKDYNVLYEDLFKNKTERKVLQELIDKYEYETTENMIKWALEHQDKYTAITKPTELKRNINKIILKNKNNITNQSNYIDYDTINN